MIDKVSVTIFREQLKRMFVGLIASIPQTYGISGDNFQKYSGKVPITVIKMRTCRQVRHQSASCNQPAFCKPAWSRLSIFHVVCDQEF